jgi:hypothetical protein
MKRKLASQLRNLVFIAMAVTLLMGQLMQLKSRTPSIALNTSAPVYAANEAEGVIDSNAVKISHKNIDKKEIYAAIKDMDIDKKKVKSVQAFLSRRGSPLAAKAEYIVKSAEIFGIDYRLVPEISIVESRGGKKTYRKLNAWGWGGSKGYTFASWEDGIYTVSKGLSRYYASGAITPMAIAPRYNPHTPKEWAGKVQYLMNQM